MKSKWGFNVTDENDPVIIPLTVQKKDQDSRDAKQRDSKEIGTLGAVLTTIISMVLTGVILTPVGIKNVPGIVIVLVWIALDVLLVWIVSKIKH